VHLAKAHETSGLDADGRQLKGDRAGSTPDSSQLVLLLGTILNLRGKVPR
jgi:hypothetical protein